MYNLFNLLSTVNQGIVTFPEWLYVRDGLKRNLTTVVNFARQNPAAVNGGHFLVRLLQSIAVPKSLPLDRYYYNVDGMALNLSMSLKMTSSIYKGAIFDGVFYGSECKEIIVATDDYFDYEKAHQNWRDLHPVEVLRHPMSDLGLGIPNGENHWSESGLCVITINIPMLAIQYRAFRENENKVIGPAGSQYSVMQFIRMYVLPNMLYSHLDQAIFNRIHNLLVGAPLGESSYRHSMALVDFSDKVNRNQLKMLQTLSSNMKDFAGILKTIPAVTQASMFEVMQTPQLAPTRQVIWALIISRLQTLNFLFRLSKEDALHKNAAQVNLIRRSLISYRSDALMRQMLPQDLYYTVQDELDSIMQK